MIPGRFWWNVTDRLLNLQVPEGMTSKLLKLEYTMEPRVPCEVDGLVENGNMIKGRGQVE